MKNGLAIVVVSYNTIELLRRCLTALQVNLQRSNDLESRVAVVDNGSVDGSAAMVAREFPEIQLMALGENRGFAAANNVAIRSLSYPFFLFLNPDTEVIGNAPSALVNYLSDHCDVGVVGGRLLNPNLSFQDSCFRFPTLPMTFLDFFPINYRLSRTHLNGRYPRTWYRRPFEVDHPLGACMCVRREAIDQVGVFDEGYFMYCEEVDWCFRMKQAGWRVCYTPDGETIHHIAASTRQDAGTMLVQLHRSRDRFFQKHYGRSFALAARQIVRFGMRAAAARARKDHLAALINADELSRRLATYQDVVSW